MRVHTDLVPTTTASTSHSGACVVRGHSEVPVTARVIGPCSVCSEPVYFADQYVNLARGRIRHQGCKRIARHTHAWIDGVAGADGWTVAGYPGAHPYEVCKCGARTAPMPTKGARLAERAGRGLVLVLARSL